VRSAGASFHLAATAGQRLEIRNRAGARHVSCDLPPFDETTPAMCERFRGARVCPPESTPLATRRVADFHQELD
jgi:hypothetical protein